MSGLISDKYREWERICDERFNRLKANEERLNHFFIGLYGISDEITPEAADSEITVRRAELVRDIKSLISYAVGCIFGRYSLDRDGLCYAGGEWDSSAYSALIPCTDNIMTINECGSGLTAAVKDFIEKVYGSETLGENLSFIAASLGGVGEPVNVLHTYLVRSFFADHAKIYRNRPIYWQFSSGRKNAFNALMYIHRYDEKLLSVLLEKYAVPYYNQLRLRLCKLSEDISSAAAAEKAGLRREITNIHSLLPEMEGFLERLKHLAALNLRLDTDDGVKCNYEKLRAILR